MTDSSIVDKIITMTLNSILEPLTTFIWSKDFFYYHGLVLASLWFVAVNIAILLRSISRTLHGIAFFAIDATTAFFIIGAFLRVYGHIQYWSEWSIIKQAHIIGGGIFLTLMTLQHMGGAITLLQNKEKNASHRKFAVVVTNLGRMVAIGGMIFGGVDKQWIIIAAILALLLLVASVYKVFFKKESITKKGISAAARAKSPPKRD